jgi:hypothetical protein
MRKSSLFVYSFFHFYYYFSTYNFVKQMTKTFNPNLLKMPIFNTLDIAIPILTPLVNIDQLVSVIGGIPRGTIDNIINNINQINNFLTTPAPTRVKNENREILLRLICNLDHAFNNNSKSFKYTNNNNKTSTKSSLHRLANTFSSN